MGAEPSTEVVTQRGVPGLTAAPPLRRESEHKVYVVGSLYSPMSVRSVAPASNVRRPVWASGPPLAVLTLPPTAIWPLSAG
jgi:hypothetical protein